MEVSPSSNASQTAVPPWPPFAQPPPNVDPVHLHAYYAAMAQITAAQAGIKVEPAQQASEKKRSAEATAQQDAMVDMAKGTINEALDDEQASIFNQLIGIVGMNDKDFWKGTLVGAAAVLLLTNETVRGSLLGLLASAGDKVKSTGDTMKHSASQTAEQVKGGVNAGADIFKDTYQASKAGFQESVEKQKQAKSQSVEPDGGSEQVS